jgi:Rubrerythrin
MSKTDKHSSRNITSAELPVHALTIELETVQSYKDLAQQMEQCGNSDVARLFAKMAKLEAEHAEKIRDTAGDTELPELAPWDLRWSGLEPPENIDIAGVHYLMTPHQALTLAPENYPPPDDDWDYDPDPPAALD